MKLDRVIMVGVASPVSVLAPLSAAAPTARMLATLREALLISRACTRESSDSELLPVSVDAAMASTCVKSMLAGSPSAVLTLFMAEFLASLIWVCRSSWLMSAVRLRLLRTMLCTMVVSGLTTVLPAVAL